MRGKKEIVIVAGALSLVLPGQPEAQPTEIKSGVVSVAQPVALGYLNKAEAQRFRIGDAVFRDQRVVTDEKGRVQLIFLDKSTLTIGPSSDLVIDEFVFNPDTGTGNMVLTASKGIFRLVGGLLSKTQSVKVNSAVGEIGIRGAVVVVEIPPEGGLRVWFFYGREVVFTGTDGAVARLTRPGSVLTVTPDGVVRVAVVEGREIADVVNRLEGLPQVVKIEVDPDDLPVRQDLIDLALELDGRMETLEALEERLGLQDGDFERTGTTLDALGAIAIGSG